MAKVQDAPGARNAATSFLERHVTVDRRDLVTLSLGATTRSRCGLDGSLLLARRFHERRRGHQGSSAR
jgi:hypothetical protein